MAQYQDHVKPKRWWQRIPLAWYLLRGDAVFYGAGKTIYTSSMSFPKGSHFSSIHFKAVTEEKVKEQPEAIWHAIPGESAYFDDDGIRHDKPIDGGES